MSLVYRSEKGTPLLADEIDENFRELDTRLKTLEDHPEMGEGLGQIQIRDGKITFTGTFGTDFGTFALPKANLKPCGLWAPQISYQKLDLVVYQTTLYCCAQEHVSTLWSQDFEVWKEVLSLPSPPSSSLPLYEKATLPVEESLGKLAILLDEEGPQIIFFNGKLWQRLMKGESL